MKQVYYLCFFLLTACSNGFQTLNSATETTQETLNNVELKAYVQSGPFEGRQVLNNISNSKLHVLLPVGLNSFVTTGPFTSTNKQISGSVISDNFGSKTLQFSVPSRWLSQGVNAPSATQLPNGDNLSLFPTGSASHVTLSLDQQSQVVLHLYAHPPYFGAFLQTPFDQGNSHQYPVTYGTSFLEMGRFSTHPHRSSLNGGLFLFISLPQ